jgi:CheY-like chemotaxis protein
MLASEDNTLAASTSQQGGRDNVCATDNLKGQIAGACDELPRNLKVLFVDDDLMLRKLFIRAVKKVAPDWIINEAASGESAINMFEEHCAIHHKNGITNEPFDLVFMDMYMASTDKQLLGTETVRMLRSKGIKSIIVGLSANNLEHKFIASGANAFVLKPIPCKPNDLKSELLRVIACGDTRKQR